MVEQTGGLAPQEEDKRTLKEEDDKPEIVVESEDKPKRVEKDEEEEEKRKTRFQERIDEITKKRREAERRELEALRRVRELEETVNNLQTTSADTEYKTLEDQIGVLERQRRNALENADFDTEAEINKRLIDARIRMQNAEQRRQYNQYHQERSKNTPVVDPRAIQFIASNQDWWEKDVEKTRYAYKIDNDLKAEGMNPASDAYWAELERRVGEYGQEQQPVKKEPAMQDREQPISSPGNPAPRRSQRPQIRITEAEQEAMAQMGIKPGSPLWDRYIEEKRKQMGSIAND